MSPTRKFGYAIAVVINAAILYAINVWPGWQALPFLTDDTRLVLDIVDISLVAGMIVNAVFLVSDRTWVKALGDLVTVAIGLAVLVRIWQVFPFDFPDASFDWALLVRVLLVIAMVGSAIGIVVQFVTLIRSLLGYGGPPPNHRADPSPARRRFNQPGGG